MENKSFTEEETGYPEMKPEKDLSVSYIVFSAAVLIMTLVALVIALAGLVKTKHKSLSGYDTPNQREEIQDGNSPHSSTGGLVTIHN